MEKLRAHQRDIKPVKAKKRPVKVVYISNPTRVTATAAQFKSLVQELTGQFSDIADLYKFADPHSAGEAAAHRGSISTATDDYQVAAETPGLGTGELHQQRHQEQQQQCGGARRMVNPSDILGETFSPDLIENLDFFMPASPCYEAAPAVDIIRGFDTWRH
ncbi:hypothetical protein Taro_026516 [Colocasia esculenta]|uniref:VQ domain-containing protein n=1 Tax=Colocasia esculenta TaxID=4460 RepID=A0A843VD62_COLES|nr:hypothetical protein [Colocasia esculenta]